MPDHVVKQGECLSRIAASYGFRDFRTIYEHPNNAEFREKRPNPNLIFPGDVIFIPDKEEKQENSSTGKVHLFEVAGEGRVLRIVLENLSGEKMASIPYQLEVEGVVINDVTDSNGLLEQPIPANAETGSLKAGNYVWPLAIAHLNPVENASDQGVTGFQARLRNMGFDPGKIDGILGPRTEAAIREFQAANPPLVVDGICGPKTLAVLIKAYGC